MGKNSSHGGKNSKYGRNEVKCQRYRRRKGKPRGPGVDGTKSGSRWVPKVREG